jgi:4-carboxymuconolactone decarboxylase
MDWLRPHARSWVVAALTVLSVWASGGVHHVSGAQSADANLPRDVHAESRNRLPLINRQTLDDRGRKAYDAAVAAAGGTLPAVEEIRLHGSGENIRWASTLGRSLTELAILTNARALDQPYEWSLHEMEAVAAGLEPAVIDVVRHGGSVAGLGAREAAFIDQAAKSSARMPSVQPPMREP